VTKIIKDEILGNIFSIYKSKTMKRLIFFFAFALLAIAVEAQKVNYRLPISYSTSNPTIVPAAANSVFWYNTSTRTLWHYDRTPGVVAWVEYNSRAYAEMGINNDTLSLSFSATTADTLEGLTSGSLSGFTNNTEGGVLTYSGPHTKKFLLTYSASFTFAEAVPVWAYIVQSGTSKLLSRTRALPATAGNTVNVSGQTILTLTTGQTVALFFVPTTHTGTDALTVYEANVTLVEIE
jgi:hypothetical protein